eukprot:137096_1
MKPCTLFRTLSASIIPPYITKSSRYCTILSTSAPLQDKLPKVEQAAMTDRLTGTASQSFTNIINPQRLGKVTEITNSIATVDGFTSAKPYTVVEFDNGVRGLVLNVDSYGCKIGILDNGKHNTLLKHSDTIRLDKMENIHMTSPSTIVGPGIIGRIVDVFGNDFAYEHNNPYSSAHTPHNTDNASYTSPVYNVHTFPNSKYITNWNTYSRTRQRIHTGIKAVDTFYPFARGLRTAIIGTNTHRKSELAMDILLSFLNHNDATDNMREKMFGVYVMIGKPPEEIWRLYNVLKDAGALEYSTIVASRHDDCMSKQLLTPYAGAAMADFYKFYGMNSFIVYDNFTVHNRICSKLYRESKGLMTYGNWSGELLERACQINAKHGHGSHSALCIADKPKDDDELNVESETFFNYLPHLVSHVDEHIMLSDESYDADLVPPISLFPVPYGIPKFMKYNRVAADAQTVDKVRHHYDQILLKLSIDVKKILFELVELETAARHQMELDIDLEPDVQRIASNVFKLQVLFTQNEEIHIQQLLLLLLCIKHRMVEYVHLDKIHSVEQRLYQYAIQAQNDKWQIILRSIEEKGNQFDIDNDELSVQLVDEFLEYNDDLCQPNALSEQNLEEPQSQFY